MKQLRFDGISKSFGDVHALRQASMRAPAGKMTALIGESGSGKSSALRIAAGLERADEGSVYVDEECIDERGPADRDVGMVFQSLALYPHMTVWDNIEYPLRHRNMTRSEQANRVREAASMLGIDGLLHRRPNEISGGEQQRVALGRALVRRPAIYLLDEPLSNVDTTLRRQLRLELRAIQRSLGATMVLVTHSVIDAMTLGDHLVLMKAGRVVQEGCPVDVYDNPQSLHVARFLSEFDLNCCRGLLCDGVLQVCEPVSIAANPARAAANEVVIGFRPEDVTFEPIGCRMFENMKVVGQTFLGASVDVCLGDGEACVHAVVERKAAPAVGRAATLYVPLDRMHVFDMDSGRRFEGNFDMVRAERPAQHDL